MLNILPVGETTEQLRTLQHGENVFHEALAHIKDGETRFYVSNPDGEDYMLAYIRNMDMFPEAARAQLKMTDGKDLFQPYLSYDETDLFAWISSGRIRQQCLRQSMNIHLSARN